MTTFNTLTEAPRDLRQKFQAAARGKDVSPAQLDDQGGLFRLLPNGTWEFIGYYQNATERERELARRQDSHRHAIEPRNGSSNRRVFAPDPDGGHSGGYRGNSRSVNRGEGFRALSRFGYRRLR